jgi:hypothetical protein
VTITDSPTHRAEPDDTQVLFEEARQRRRRRRLAAGIVAIVVILLGITIGVLATQGAGHSPRPVTPASVAPVPAAAVATSSFSIRQVLCYAPPYTVPPGQTSSTGPLPACSPSTQLTATNLQVTPGNMNIDGYTANSNINPDPQFATYPSTTSSSDERGQDVLLPGTPSGGSTRYVLGPVGLGRSAIASARATYNDGQWAVDLVLTPKGSTQWDNLAQQTFHEITGVVINGHVVSAPIMQPTQSSFTSFDGQLQVSATFSEHQAKAIASAL